MLLEHINKSACSTLMDCSNCAMKVRFHIVPGRTAAINDVVTVGSKEPLENEASLRSG